LRWEHWTVAVLLAAMALIAFMNILGRYIFHYSLAFTEELTVNLFVWLTVVGSGLAFERGAQLGMVSMLKLFPRRLKRGVVIFSSVLSVCLFVAVDILIIQTIYYEVTLFKATSPALGVPIWVYYAGVPLLSIAVFRGVCRGTVKSLSECGETVCQEGRLPSSGNK